MKQHPEIPDVNGLTLEYIIAHPLFASASDAEVAYSAGVPEHVARAVRWRTAANRTERKA
jgi:hypothetical protein